MAVDAFSADVCVYSVVISVYWIDKELRETGWLWKPSDMLLSAPGVGADSKAGFCMC